MLQYRLHSQKKGRWFSATSVSEILQTSAGLVAACQKGETFDLLTLERTFENNGIVSTITVDYGICGESNSRANILGMLKLYKDSTNHRTLENEIRDSK